MGVLNHEPTSSGGLWTKRNWGAQADAELVPAIAGSTRQGAETRTHAGKGEALRLRDAVTNDCCRATSGKHLLLASISHFDLHVWSGRAYRVRNHSTSSQWQAGWTAGAGVE